MGGNTCVPDYRPGKSGYLSAFGTAAYCDLRLKFMSNLGEKSMPIQLTQEPAVMRKNVKL